MAYPPDPVELRGATTLREQEEIVERGLASFVEVGQALMRIREEGLYREAGFDGFVEYLESKPWGIDWNAAYKQIQAAAVVKVVPAVQTERQARELAPLLNKTTPQVVQQVYAEVVDETGGKPTAAAIREKVREVLPQPTNGHSDPRVIEDALAALETFNKLSGRITPEVLGRLSQSACKRYEARAAIAEAYLVAQRAEIKPRLDSLTPTRRG